MNTDSEPRATTIRATGGYILRDGEAVLLLSQCRWGDDAPTHADRKAAEQAVERAVNNYPALLESLRWFVDLRDPDNIAHLRTQARALLDQIQEDL